MRLYLFGSSYLAALVFRARSCKSVRCSAGIACLALAFVSSGGALAATSANAQSPLGMNLYPVNYWTGEQPFINIFKTSGVSQSNSTGTGWITHSNKTYAWDTQEEAYLQLDANGYPTTLTANSSDPNSPQKFDSVGVILLRQLGKSNAGTGMYYPAGQYVVLYDGEGTLFYEFDAKLISSTPGRDVVNVASATSQGISIRINATDPNHTGNYLRNIRLVKAELESSFNAGAVFTPTLLSALQNFRLVRGMQWLNIDSDGGKLVSWSQRPQMTDGGYGGPNGTPIEAVIQLCNATGADCWLNVPHMANNDYITQMAALAHTMLGTSQKVYIEFSNEVWNWDFGQNSYATAQGKAMWPNAGSGADYGPNWYGMRAAQTCDIWKSTWGTDAARVVCVMGAFSDIPSLATEELNCPLWTGAGNAPCANHGIGAVAIAPYVSVNNKTASAWTTASDGGLASLFQAMNDTALPQSAGWEAKYKAALAPYNLPFIAYEGGQSLVAFPQFQDGSAVSNLFIAANRDPRMAGVYTTALNNWKAAGGQIYVIFADVVKPSEYGVFGALESLWDTVTPLSSAPPKWQAIQNFMSANKCWWAGCAGTIASTTAPVPMAPSNLTVK